LLILPISPFEFHLVICVSQTSKATRFCKATQPQPRFELTHYPAKLSNTFGVRYPVTKGTADDEA